MDVILANPPFGASIADGVETNFPQSTFHPATVSTNLLFFRKGTSTKEIWYYEHRLPEGQKSYSKTKTIQFDEFAPMIEWWDKRRENEVAWRVRAEGLKKGFDLDVKNPRQPQAEKQYSSAELLDMLHQSFVKSDELLAQIRRALKQ